MNKIECVVVKGPVKSVVDVPGSKSLANRALVCAALAGAGSIVKNVPSGDDTNLMVEALRDLGCNIVNDASSIEITRGLDLNETSSVSIHVGLAGTTSRFLTALSALRAGPVVIDGFDALRERPMRDLHDALVAINVNIEAVGNWGYLPVRVSRGHALDRRSTMRLEISGSTSSQFASALLLVAPYFSGGLVLHVTGQRVSDSYLLMTIEVMRSFGAIVDVAATQEALVVTVVETPYEPTTFIVEPDASSASYPLAIGALVGGEVGIRHLHETSLQGDVVFLQLMQKMGCEVQFNDEGVLLRRDVTTPLVGIDINMVSISDLVPTMAVVALFASSVTRISGVGFIRHKESDRLGDLADELRKCGAKIDEQSDGLVITPAPLHGAVLATHHDHRLAMAFAVLGAVIPGVTVENPDVVSKSWPQFWKMRDAMVSE